MNREGERQEDIVLIGMFVFFLPPQTINIPPDPAEEIIRAAVYRHTRLMNGQVTWEEGPAEEGRQRMIN